MSRYRIVFLACAAHTCGGLRLNIADSAAQSVKPCCPITNPGETTWMHIPKTGTSFVIPLSVVMCPNIPDAVYEQILGPPDQIVKSLICQCKQCGCSSCNGLNQYHSPYNKSHAGHILGMFRDPAVRIVSQFMYKGGFGGGWGDMEELRNSMRSLPSDISRTQQFLKYAQHPTTLSCQTKMLLGHECVSHVSLTPEDTKEAIRRLREDFLFVGLTDAWKESVELLHSMTGTVVRSFETLNIRPAGKDNKSQAKAETLLDGLLKSGWSDPHDSEIFAEAARLMNERMGYAAVSPSLDRSRLRHGWWTDEFEARDRLGPRKVCTRTCGV